MAPRTTTACVSALAAVYSDAAAVAARLRARGLPVPAAALAAVEEALLLGPPVLEGACAFQTKKLEIAAKHDSGKTKHPHDDANQAQDVNARRSREVWLADNDLDEIDNIDDDDDDNDNDDDDYDWTSGWGSEGSLDSTDAADTASRVSARVAAASAAFVRGDAAARDRLDEIRAGLQLNALVRLRLVLLDQCAFDGRWLQAAADTARVDAVMCLARLATRVAAGGLGQGQPGLLQEPNQPQQQLQTPEPPKRAPSVTSAASSADGFRQRRSRANSAHSGGSSSAAAAPATTTTARSPVHFPPYPHPPPQLPLPQPPATAPAAAGPTSSPAPSTSALSRAVAAGHTNSVPPAQPFASATSAPSLRASHASSTDSDYSSATTLSSRSLRSSAASHSSSAAVVTGYAYPYGYGQYSPYGSSPSTGPDELPRSRGASHSSARRATPPLSDHPISTISEHDPGVYTAPSALEESSAAAAAAAATAAATATNSSSSSLSLPGTRPPLTLSTGPIDIPGRGGRPPPPMSVPLPMQQPGRQRALSSTAAPASSLGVGPAFAPMLPPPASPLPLTPGSASAVAAASAPLQLSGISMSAVSPPSPSPSQQQQQQQQQQSSTRSSSFLRPIRRRGTDPPPMPSIPQISAPIPLNIPPNSSLSANLSQSAPTIDLFLPSEENGFAGFCKGAWKLQIGLRRAFRIEQRPAGMYSQVLFWRCHKCSFEGPLNNPAVHPIVPPDVNPTASGFQRTVPNDKSGRDFDQTVRVHAPSGIRFRWAFLAKSHVHSKSAAKHQAAQAQAVHSAAAAAAGAHASSAPTTTGSSLTSSLPSSPPASYLGPAAASGGGPTSTGYGCAGAFACIFCCVDNQAAPPVFASADTFLSHVRLHDGARVPGHRRAPPTQVLERSKCILGRVAADWEEFDVCIPPFVDAI